MAKKTTSPTSDHQHHDHTHAHPANTTTQSNLVAPNSHIHLTLAWEKVAPVYERHLKRVAQRVKLPGFRPGKVPAALAEKSVDRSAILDPVLQELLPVAYTEELKKQGKAPLSQPEIDPESMEKDQDWKFTIYFAEKPEVKLGEYKKAVKSATQEAEKEITEKEKELKNTAKTSEKKTTKDDTGKTAPTALTDTQKEDVKLRHIFKSLAQSAGPAVPEMLIRGEVNRDLNRLADQLAQFNVPVDKYLASRQMTVDQLRQEYAQTALTSLQLEFILAEIAKTEKITVEDKEIDETLDTLQDGKLTKEQKTHPDNRSYVFSSLLKQKVVKHLLSLS